MDLLLFKETPPPHQDQTLLVSPGGELKVLALSDCSEVEVQHWPATAKPQVKLLAVASPARLM